MISDACTCAADNGVEASKFYARVFSECIYDTRRSVSYILGLISLCCWIVVCIPQFMVNVKRRNGDGLSFVFLFSWLTGDILYLIATQLTNVLPTTRFLGIWFAVADSFLTAQSIYYHYRVQIYTKIGTVRKCRAAGITSTAAPGESAAVTAQRENITRSVREEVSKPVVQDFKRGRFLGLFDGTVLSVIACAVLAWFWYVYESMKLKDAWVTDLCASAATLHDPDSLSYKFGNFCGYINILFYVGSRPGQIYHNFKRRSVEGVSLLFFCCTLTGNFTQGISYFMYDSSADYILEQLPFILSSAGVGLLDVVILGQFIHYNVGKKKGGSGDVSNELVDTSDAPRVSMDGSVASTASDEILGQEAIVVRNDRSSSAVTLQIDATA